MNENEKKRGNKLALLIGLLVFGFCEYYAVEYAQAWLDEPDYSSIPVADMRVGYCMMQRLNIKHKSMIADTMLRPPSEDMAAVVLPVAMNGPRSEEKRSALLALRQRQDLRLQAEQAVNDEAGWCGFWRGGVTPGVTPLEMATNWLSHDPAYIAFLKTGRTRDAASAFYDKHRIRKTS